MLHHIEGNCWHTQNIQINKVIGENEKYVFYFTEKKHNGILANPAFFVFQMHFLFSST